MFDELFLTKEEEKRYQLEKLEKHFILSKEDMLDMLRRKAVDTKISANLARDAYLDYKRRTTGFLPQLWVSALRFYDTKI